MAFIIKAREILIFDFFIFILCFTFLNCQKKNRSKFSIHCIRQRKNIHIIFAFGNKTSVFKVVFHLFRLPLFCFSLISNENLIFSLFASIFLFSENSFFIEFLENERTEKEILRIGRSKDNFFTGYDLWPPSKHATNLTLN